jgi:hypothetical protein
MDEWFQDDNAKKIYSKGLFGSHHLGLESKNLFTILTILIWQPQNLDMEFYGFSSHAKPIGYPIIFMDLSK